MSNFLFLEKPPGQIIMMLQQYVNPDEPFCTLSLCYKAVWVIGEIAMKLGNVFFV